MINIIRKYIKQRRIKKTPYNPVGFTPSSVDMTKVINRLDKFNQKYPESKLNMFHPHVNNHDHKCGTVHCHGGNYAVQCLDEELLKGIVSYNDGAKMMAKHLGFKSRGALEKWAEFNSKLWGNIRGDGMFSCEFAFISSNRPEGALNNQDIINHWLEVRNRIIEVENYRKKWGIQN